MKFSIPTVGSLKTQGINSAGLFVGVLGGYALQNFLMKPRTGKDGVTKDAIIKDSALLNGLGAVLGLGLAAAAGSPFVQMVGLGVAVIFAIRAVNRVTEGLSGVDGLSGGLKTFLDKNVPKLSGDAFDLNMGGFDYTNEPLMLPMNGVDELGRPILEAPFLPSNAAASTGRHA